MAGMKEQEKKIINLQRRRNFAWVACFALLFGMLMMPMTPTMPQTQGEQVAWPRLCSGYGSSLAVTYPGLVDQRVPDHAHAAMQGCSCCSGSLTMVAIPANMSFGFYAFVPPMHFPTAVVVFPAPARLQWPIPRASPRV
jgi:hypothetical protein